MKHRVCQIFPTHPTVLLGLILFVFSGTVHSAQLYKWIDENGVVRYGDQLPVDKSKKRHQTLNSQGVIVNTTEIAKTPEEMAAIRKAESDRKALEKVEAKEKDMKRRRDQALLTTYGSVDELELLKDKRMEMVDLVIQLIYKSMATARQRIDLLENKAMTEYVDKGDNVPDGLAQNIEMLTRSNQIRQKRLRQRLIEKNNILAQYEEDVVRYRKLTGQYPEAPIAESN